MSALMAVGLGELMLRLSPNPDERLEVANLLHVHAAGAEANVIAALARLGVPAALVTHLPDTPLGHRAAGELAAAGADLSLVCWHAKARIGTFFVEQGSGARPTSVNYDRARSAFAEHAEWPVGRLEGAGFAVVSGITPALSERARIATEAMVGEAHMRGVPLCVDVNHRTRLWSAEAARAGIAPLLKQATIMVCSQSDALTVLGEPEPDPVRLRERWAPNAQLCVITCGERGCVASTPAGDLIETPGVPTHVVDRLGIGDAFVAGLLYGLLDRRPAQDALRAAAMLASLKATVSGDFSLTRADELGAALTPSPTSGILR